MRYFAITNIFICEQIAIADRTLVVLILVAVSEYPLPDNKQP